MADGGKAQLAVDGLAKDPVDSPGVYGLDVGYWPAGYASFKERVNETLRSPPTRSQESVDLVAGEDARVQAYQGDPFGLLPGDSNRLQQFFSSLQVGDQGFPGLGHGVAMPAASSLLMVFYRASSLAHFLRGTASPSVGLVRGM